MAIFAKKQVVTKTDGAKAGDESANDTKADAPAGDKGQVPGAELAAAQADTNEIPIADTSEGVADTTEGMNAAALPQADMEAEGIEPVEIEAAVIDSEVPVTIAVAPAFGINDAIRLMRSLPSDPNMDLVVRVVRVTLGAVNVSVEEITADALRREQGIQGSISVLQEQVTELEKQLYARRCEIAAHEADLKETANVRERLQLADKYTGNRPPPPPADATRIGPVKPADWAAEWERSQRAQQKLTES